jgi:ABC-type transporter Mla MlaB component
MVKHPWYGMNCSDVKETYTLMDFTSAGVASDTLYVTGCHPRLSRSLEDDRSHALCVTDLRVSSSSRPLCCNQKWSCASVQRTDSRHVAIIIDLLQAMFEHSAHLVCSCVPSMPRQAG